MSDRHGSSGFQRIRSTHRSTPTTSTLTEASAIAIVVALRDVHADVAGIGRRPHPATTSRMPSPNARMSHGNEIGWPRRRSDHVGPDTITKAEAGVTRR